MYVSSFFNKAQEGDFSTLKYWFLGKLVGQVHVPR